MYYFNFQKPQRVDDWLSTIMIGKLEG